MAREYVFIERMERARFVITADPTPTITPVRCELYSFYYPLKGVLTISAQCDAHFSGSRDHEAESFDDAVRRSRREMAAYYRDLPGHSLVEHANAELARCVIIAADPPPDDDAEETPGAVQTLAQMIENMDTTASAPHHRLSFEDLGHDEPFLTGNEVAALLGMSIGSIHRIRRGRPHIAKPFNRTFLFSRDHIKRVRDHHTQNPQLNMFDVFSNVD